MAVSGGTLSAPSQPSVTGFKSPTANAPVTTNSGDNNGFEVNPANAYASDNVFAVDNNSGNGTSTTYTSTQKDRHVFQGFAFGAAGRRNDQRHRGEARGQGGQRPNGAPKMYIELLHDGLAAWTAAKVTPTLSKTKTAYVLGSGSDILGWRLEQHQYRNPAAPHHGRRLKHQPRLFTRFGGRAGHIPSSRSLTLGATCAA